MYVCMYVCIYIYIYVCNIHERKAGSGGLFESVDPGLGPAGELCRGAARSTVSMSGPQVESRDRLRISGISVGVGTAANPYAENPTN